MKPENFVFARWFLPDSGRTATPAAVRSRLTGRSACAACVGGDEKQPARGLFHSFALT